MASLFKKGDLVELKVVVPQGKVQSIRMDDEGMVWYLIPWVDAEGQSQQRWFAETELKLLV
jgi:uncharacterized protein YodC (DUF2158 family)